MRQAVVSFPEATKSKTPTFVDLKFLLARLEVQATND